MEAYSVLLLFFAGLIAGFVNVMAGGGSTLTLPLLIFLGLDGATANGTNRLAILIQNISAIIGFQKGKSNAFGKSIKLSLFALPGAVAGAFIAIKVSDPLFRQILGGVIILVIISMFLPKPTKDHIKQFKNKTWYLYLSMFGIGFYGGFIQAGVGFLLMAALYHLTNLNLVKVNAYKVFIVFIYTIPAFAVFIIAGKIDWAIGFALAAGNASGAWLSSQLQVKKGEKIIKYILIIILLFMSVKLIFSS